MESADLASLEPSLEGHRRELTGFCYRMLGSASEAEDAVQETMLRAWRGYDRFEGRASLRSWLYRIATNVCLTMAETPQRRARPMDLGPAAAFGADLGAPLPETTWIEPISDGRVLETVGDPAELAVRRETISLAFLSALQHLPPRQRAVLILREVLCWRSDEVAELLETSVASIKSALQRARATMSSLDVTSAEPYLPDDARQRRLLDRYVDAFQRHDVDALVSLLREDAISSMPPFRWWLRGRADIGRVFAVSDACRDDRLVPTVANGLPAFGQYRPDSGGRLPFALVVMELSDGLIAGTTTFLGIVHRFPEFGLPTRLEPNG